MRRTAEQSGNSTKRLEMMLARFDPDLHSGDVAEDVVPIGREFGAKVRR